MQAAPQRWATPLASWCATAGQTHRLTTQVPEVGFDAPEDHLARFVADVVHQLDLSEIYDYYERKDGRGLAAYHPEMLARAITVWLRDWRVEFATP